MPYPLPRQPHSFRLTGFRSVGSRQQRGRGALRILGVAVVLGVASWPAIAASPQLAAHTWMGAGGEPLPFQTDAEILEFLRVAEVVSAVELVSGTTRPYRVLLRHEGVEASAVFRDVDERKALAEFTGERFFRDSAMFECAAYELSRMLNLDHVPPAVDHTWDRKQGSLQLWVEGTMTESERVSSGQFDPATQRWNRQLNSMNLFDALIGNIDRNRGNILIDDHWRLWFIDHTRAFRGSSKVETDELTSIERRFWEGLQSLSDDEVSERIGGYLTGRELKGLLGRAERLREHFKRLIRDQGEAQVVYDY